MLVRVESDRVGEEMGGAAGIVHRECWLYDRRPLDNDFSSALLERTKFCMGWYYFNNVFQTVDIELSQAGSSIRSITEIIDQAPDHKFNFFKDVIVGILTVVIQFIPETRPAGQKFGKVLSAANSGKNVAQAVPGLVANEWPAGDPSTIPVQNAALNAKVFTDDDSVAVT
ncbi:uncharacterized protein KY384_003999 [Bacidia gigantensis]|uniref:uncharacterized protein n=1 Tax=Bacidia gigantensis TaxID=2732470 RepID=UPI001D0593CB|nr:uncharacterized protein KY384_003999 [Bacidia gigantensis]KAG8531287.1 hypothetical protein KY384_003999 [Bacidia gigantensis]